MPEKKQTPRMKMKDQVATVHSTAFEMLKAYQQRDADEIIQPMLPDPTTMAQPGAQPGDAAAVSTAEPPPEPVTAL